MKVLPRLRLMHTAIILLLLPGCMRIIDWGTRTFEQASLSNVDIAKAQSYIRSITLYDQLSTKARFEALWLSDEVRINYTNLYALKFGKTEDQKKAFLRRQLEENNHFISFYVLSLHEYTLGEVNSDWNLLLEIDNKLYNPIEVKLVELSPEYIYIFGKRYNRFKVPYMVKFDAKDIDDKPLITPDTKSVILHCRSIELEIKFVWEM